MTNVINGKYRVKNSQNNYDVVHLETSAEQVKFEDGETLQEKLSNFATADDIHSHDNKEILDSITEEEINYWNNKSDFSGNYKDLNGLPEIPVVDVNKEYVDGKLIKKANSEDVYTKEEIDLKVGSINDELSKSDNTKYITENGIKEFNCKDGYIDNIVIEGLTKILDDNDEECEAGADGSKLVSVGQGDKIEILTYSGENLFNGEFDKGYFNVTCEDKYREDLYTDVPTRTTKWIECKPNTEYCIIGGNRRSIHFKSEDSITYFEDMHSTYYFNNQKLPSLSVIRTSNSCTHLRVYYEREGEYTSPLKIIEGRCDKKEISTTLRSLPNGVKDTIEKMGNKYVKIQRCYEFKYNNEDFTWIGSIGGGVATQVNIKLEGYNSSRNTMSCNLAQVMYGDDIPSTNDTSGRELVFYVKSNSSLCLRLSNSKISASSDVSTIKKYLMDNNYTVVLELETPIITELTNFNPQTYEGDTTFIVDTGVIQSECEFEVTNSKGNEIEVLKDKVTGLDSETYRIRESKSDVGHYHSVDENMTILYKGSLNIISGEIPLSDNIYNYKAIILNCGNVGGGKNTSAIIYPFNLGYRQEGHGKIRTSEEMYTTLFSGSTSYKCYFKPTSNNNLYFELRNSDNTVVTTNPDSSLFVIRYIMGVK